MSYFREGGKKKVNDSRLQEMYDWYRDIRRAVVFWSGLLDGLFLLVTTLILTAVVMGIPYYFYTEFWKKVTVDTKFTAIIAILIFILGIVIGRKTKRKKK